MASSVRPLRPWCRAAIVTVPLLVVLALACGQAQAKVVHVNGHTYGVFFKPGAPAISGGHAKGEAQVPLTYGGLPVMLHSKFYAIYWGASGSFPAGYESTINQYLSDLHLDSGKLTNDYSVSTQYCQGVAINASTCPAGSTFITSTNTVATPIVDTHAYPTTQTEGCQGDASTCIADSQIQTEIKALIAAGGLETDPASAPVAQYLMFLPPNVDSCMAVGVCTFSASGFCGYHGEITGANGASNIAIFSNDPYEPGCDSGNVPAGAANADADGALDTLIHELNESSTDPIGGNGWTDASGFEIGDKCENGPINNGLPLGGSATAAPPTLYNQLIHGHQYYTQTMWSNVAEQTPSGGVAGCLQRLGASPVFLPPTGVAAGKPEVFDASNSYDAAHPITSYVWNFGDGTGNINGEKLSHTFAAGGTYTVTLTVNDSSNNPSTETMKVTVPQLLISQLRPGVSAANQNSFVEMYNPTASTVSTNGWHLVIYDKNFNITQNVDLSMFGNVAPGGYLLEGGNQYSLGAYAQLDLQDLTALVPDTTVTLVDPTGSVDDAVCLCGSPLSATGIGTFSGSGEYAFVRSLHTGVGGTLGSTGTPQLTGNNLNDFALVQPQADNTAGTVLPATEGSPGPHSTSGNSPTIANPKIGLGLLAGTDPSAAPNQALSAVSPPPGAVETLYIRRKITNNTGSSISSLRFRVSEITTGATPAPPVANAILRILSDPGGTVPFGGTNYTLTPTSLNAPATANADGGGLNASVSVPSITGAKPLAPGASIYIEFRLGVQRAGHFRFYFNTEALPPVSPPMCGLRATAPTYKHVIVLFEENNSYNSIYKSASAPYINSVMTACGLATNYHNITHPSLPNYIGATNGATLAQLGPFLPDCTPSVSCESTGNNVFNEVNSAGGWKGYAESMPSACDKANAGFYAPRHNPEVYYTDLANCTTNDVPLGTTGSSPLLQDFSSEATAPALATVTPNLCDDMHGVAGCPSNLILAGDNFLKTWLPLITSTRVYQNQDTLVLIVWDEGEPGTSGEDCATNTSDQSCHVVSMVIGPSVKPGTQSATLFNHYSLLKTAEDLLGVPELGLSSSATSMIAAFNL